MELLTVQQPSHPGVGSSGSDVPAEILALLVAVVLIVAIWTLYLEWRDSHDGGARRLVLEAQRWLRHQ